MSTGQPQSGDDGRTEADRSKSTRTAPVQPKLVHGTIGPYRILETLGEGGFGVVYLAEQTEPVRRRVALKVIKPGMDSRAVIARFEAERQALAMMDHQHVAKVFDAGTTEQGRPYFVMEHVPGIRITDHCDRQKLDINDRLALFTQVCDAVQHAHQKGIIHRDIKPSNVLVTTQGNKPLVKVIDFGVAKAIHQHLTEKTIFTKQGQLIGTPAYMSPEQAEMTAQDIDTRSDIYSLGVMLYELLVGALPFDPAHLRERGFAEIQRVIREEEPPKPSTRLSSLGPDSTTFAQKRRTDPSSLQRQLRGDLDWVTMKAMDKDRTRRYAGAAELAADIVRHLKNEPVLAGPPSATYRAAKFIRRNRTAVIATTAVAVALVVGTAGLAVGLAAARQEGYRAQRSAEAERQARLAEKHAREEAQAANADARAKLEIALDTASLIVEKVDPFLATAAGALEPREELLAAVQKFFDGVLPDSSDVRLMRLAARAFEHQTAHAMQRGDLAEARTVAESVLELHERITKLEPSASSFGELSKCLVHNSMIIGFGDARRQSLLSHRAIETARRAVELAPNDVSALEALATSLSFMCVLHSSTEGPDAIQRYADEARQVLEILSAMDPAQADEYEALVAQLPDVKAAKSQPSTPISQIGRTASIQSVREALDRDPEDVIKKFKLAGELVQASVANHLSKIEHRISWAEEAYELLLPLYEQEPENMMYSGIPVCAAVVAELLREAGERDRGLARWRDWADIRQRIAERQYFRTRSDATLNRYIWALFGSVVADPSQAGPTLKLAEDLPSGSEIEVLRSLCELRQQEPRRALLTLRNVKAGLADTIAGQVFPALEARCLFAVDPASDVTEVLSAMPDGYRMTGVKRAGLAQLNNGLGYDLRLLLDEIHANAPRDQ